MSLRYKNSPGLSDFSFDWETSTTDGLSFWIVDGQGGQSTEGQATTESPCFSNLVGRSQTCGSTQPSRTAPLHWLA